MLDLGMGGVVYRELTCVGIFEGVGGGVEGCVDGGEDALVKVECAVVEGHVFRRVEVLV